MCTKVIQKSDQFEPEIPSNFSLFSFKDKDTANAAIEYFNKLFSLYNFFFFALCTTFSFRRSNKYKLP